MNVKPKIIKLLGENIEGNFLDIDFGKEFLDMTLKAQAIKAKVNQRDHIKLKAFCTVKESGRKLKSPPTEWEMIFANSISYRELISKI